MFATVPGSTCLSRLLLKRDFNRINITELKKHLQERGIAVSVFTVLKSSLVEIAAAVEAMMLPVERQNQRCRQSINPNPFSMKSRS